MDSNMTNGIYAIRPLPPKRSDLTIGGDRTFRFEGAPLHVEKRIDRQKAQVLVRPDAVKLICNLGVYSVEGAAFQSINWRKGRSENFFNQAFGRNRLIETLKRGQFKCVAKGEFSAALAKWLESDPTEPLGVYTGSVIDESGAIEFGSPLRSVFRNPTFYKASHRGQQVFLTAAREGEDHVMYAIDARTNELIDLKYIDPNNGMLFDWAWEPRARSLQRVYAAKTDSNHRTYFGKIDLLWPLYTNEGQVMVWRTNETGSEFIYFSNKSYRAMTARPVLDDSGETTAVILGENTGSENSRYAGISGRVKIKLVHRNILAFGRSQQSVPEAALKGIDERPNPEIEVKIREHHVVEHYTARLPLIHIYQFDAKKKKWELTNTTPSRVSAEEIEGLAMLQGVELHDIQWTKGAGSLGFQVGGESSVILCELPYDLKIRVRATVIYKDGKPVWASLNDRLPPDLRDLVDRGEVLSAKGDRRQAAVSAEFAEFKDFLKREAPKGQAHLSDHLLSRRLAEAAQKLESEKTATAVRQKVENRLAMALGEKTAADRRARQIAAAKEELAAVEKIIGGSSGVKKIIPAGENGVKKAKRVKVARPKKIQIFDFGKIERALVRLAACDDELGPDGSFAIAEQTLRALVAVGRNGATVQTRKAANKSIQRILRYFLDLQISREDEGVADFPLLSSLLEHTARRSFGSSPD